MESQQMATRRIMGVLVIGLGIAGCGKPPDPAPTRPASAQEPAPLTISNALPLPTATTQDGSADGRAPVTRAPDAALPSGAPASLAVFLDQGEATRKVVPAAGESEARTALSAREASKVESAPPCQNWPTPKLALFITGRQDGYIEPCGCTGLANAKGGLNRRFTLQKQLRARGWDIVPLDVGNQVNRYGVQAELKFQTTVNALRRMNYEAVAFGPNDLRLSIGELAIAIAGDDANASQSVFVCANVNVLGDMNVKYRVIEREGIRLGVTAILGRAEAGQVNSDEIQLSDPVAALKQVVPELIRRQCTHLILLAHTSLNDSRELAKQFPEFDLIITGGGAGEPTKEPEKIPGAKAPMIQVGTKGMYVGIVGLYEQPKRGFRFERVVLDASFPDDPGLLQAFQIYQRQLQDKGLEGLGLTPVRHPRGNVQFVGHEVCGECHTKALEIYEGSAHAHATESIAKPTERSQIPRHFDPECLSCHVTGWNPQDFYPYVSGYLDYKKSAALHGNGCENCHGPGSAHVAAENGDLEIDDTGRDQLRASMRLSLEDAKTRLCYECHDLDNSPDFQPDGAFETYWEQIKHQGMD